MPQVKFLFTREAHKAVQFGPFQTLINKSKGSGPAGASSAATTSGRAGRAMMSRATSKSIFKKKTDTSLLSLNLRKKAHKTRAKGAKSEETKLIQNQTFRIQTEKGKPSSSLCSDLSGV